MSFRFQVPGVRFAFRSERNVAKALLMMIGDIGLNSLEYAMQKVLFLGNGINRLTNHGVSWDDAICDLAKDVGGTELLDHRDYVPFTLIYEGFCSKSSVNSKRGVTPLKKKVAMLLIQMVFNPFHKQVMDLGLNHIITTNYDYSLENSISHSFKPEYFRREGRYSVFRRVKIANTNVWHVHGETEKPETITLGHEQYSGQLENLRKHLTSMKTSPFRNHHYKFENSDLKYSWGDIFLRDEIHIVGFSLDYSEIDIWWLLTFKAQYESRYKIKCGPTVFHYWSDKPQDKKDKGKIELLKSLKVKVVEKFNVNYENMYSEFLNGFLGNAATNR